jgi:hypothetical protein
MTSLAISRIIGELPFPFRSFASIIWDGLEENQDGGQEMLKILERISDSNEKEFEYIKARISTLISAQAQSEKEIVNEIVTSNKSVLEILGSRMQKLSITSDKIDRNVETVLKLIQQGKRQGELTDYDIFLKYRVVFDRPAFKSPYTYHSDIEDYIRSLQDTIKAINTGLLLTRHGVEITRTSPKTFIRNEKWRNTMQDIEVTLSEIVQMQYNLPDSRGLDVEQRWKEFYSKVDGKRDQIILSLNEIWNLLGIPTLPIPSEMKKWDEETLLTF